MKGYVYILASARNGTLYVGVTRDIVRRLHEHRSDALPGFTERYGVHRLVHLEEYDWLADAIAREKRLKKWKRAWKLQLIEEGNPRWADLAPTLGFDPS
ncbi:MAG: GIY-YIG nuclease family protein [Proteobacteria bacterium]|jgi:putative endonuclease|nr:GIY-YIG nuclease family protein [Pseudomonadota bacterium]MDA1073014.1 GIY-YIG nuclease family protein [Pseudomonadota bacterium]